jgi:hypothetical protein
MYKRPPLRVNTPEVIHNSAAPPKDSFIHKLLNPPPTIWYKHIQTPVYQKENYLALLKRNCEDLGIEYKEPDIPDKEEEIETVINHEPILENMDQVYLKLRFLKSGIIRVKLDTSLATLYEKYYSQTKIPPLKSVIQAYKSMGFSEESLEKIKKRHERRIKFGKRISKAIDLIFNKEPAKKTKKKKKEEELVEEEPEERELEQEEPDEQEDDDDPGEDGEMDVELDEDEEEPQEPQEEMYLSDGGD